MVPEPVDVEQWAGVAARGEPCGEPLEQRRLGRELERERFVFAERIRHELRQSGGMQQASRDARGEGLAHAGQDRQPRPQRVRGRIPGVARQRIEKQAGQAMARQVVLMRRQFRCEDEPFGVHAAPFGLGAKIG
jgi:hypothetical protein